MTSEAGDRQDCSHVTRDEPSSEVLGQEAPKVRKTPTAVTGKGHADLRAKHTEYNEKKKGTP